MYLIMVIVKWKGLVEGMFLGQGLTRDTWIHGCVCQCVYVGGYFIRNGLMQVFCFLSGGDGHGCGADNGLFVWNLTGIFV